jgi:CelD/BcsL family acetyltransferase involved in cellulose biosynthesis
MQGYILNQKLPGIADNVCRHFRWLAQVPGLAFSTCSAPGDPDAPVSTDTTPPAVATSPDARPANPQDRSPEAEDYTIERITSLDEFDHLKDEWNGLLHEDTRHKPYLEHEYFRLWLEHGDPGGELSFVLIRRHGRLEAIFPFVLKRERHRGWTLRHLEFLGITSTAMRTPMFGDLGQPAKDAILQAFFRHLARSVKWDTLRLNFIPTEDFTLETVERILSTERLAHKERVWFSGWYLDGIDVTGQQYMATRPKHIRRNMKRFTKQYGNDGGIRLEIITGGDDETIDRAMDHFHTVYKHSWKEWEFRPTFDRALVRLARDRGYLRLGLLFVHDRPVAGQLWFVCNRRAYGEKKAYDEQFKKVSPGITLTAAMITHAIDQDKVREIDHLYGDDTYKAYWTPQQRERKNILIYNRHSLRGWLLGYVMPKIGPFMQRFTALRSIRKAILKILRVR